MKPQPPNLTLDRSHRLFQRALDRIPGGSQTFSKRPARFAPGGYPIYAAQARGARVVDVDGNEYIDLVQALGPVVLGYSYPAVDAAVREQLEKGILFGLLSPCEVECAERICEVVPCAEMVRFFKGGGEATAAAARTVRGFTGRELILNSGYRGWPDVWASLSADRAVPAALASSVVEFRRNDLDDLVQKLRAHRGEVAAVFMDVDDHASFQYLAEVKALCHRDGALLVFDEVVTGFRLALGGAQAHAGVIPDVACFAKALANGMPLAAVAGRADVMAGMSDRFVSITYGGEALSLAAAIAVIDELRQKSVHDHLWRIGGRLRDGLNDAARQSGVAFECGGFPPMTTMRFLDADPVAQLATARAPRREIGADLTWEFFLQEMAARGVLMNRGGLNFITFSHVVGDVDEIVEAARDVFLRLRQLWGTPGLAGAVAARKQRL